jgi:outer membrane assembly lipoprotein YfiO
MPDRITRQFLLPGLMAALAWLMPTGPAQAQPTYELGQQGWQKQATPDPDSPAGKLATIRKRIIEDKAEKAAQLARQWIEQYPNHPRMPEARLLLGDALVAQNRYYDSLYQYERLVRQYPGSDQFMIALQREFRIARQFTGGLNRLFLGMRLLPAEGEGEELLIRIQERAPGSRVGEKASITLADYYFRQGEMEHAATAYDMFLINYPNSMKRQWAMKRLIEASLARFEGPPYNPTGLLEARQRLETYVNEFPAAAEKMGADSLRVRINESLAAHDLRTADWFEGQGEDLSAIVLYRRLIQQFPQTSAARTALNRVEALQTPMMDEQALSIGDPDKAPPPQSGVAGQPESPDQPQAEPPTGADRLSPPTIPEDDL